MSRDPVAYPDKLSKALARYRQESGITTTVLSDDSDRGGAQDTVQAAECDSTVWPYQDARAGNAVVGASGSPNSASLADVGHAALQTANRADHGPADNHALIEDRSRIRRRVRIMLALVAIPSLVAVAMLRVDKNIVLPADVDPVGEETVVLAPQGGVVDEGAFAVAGQVKIGQLLMVLEQDRSAEVLAATRDWIALKLREDLLDARIDGDRQATLKDRLAEQFPQIDVAELQARAQQYIDDDADAETEILVPLRNDVDKVDADLKSVWEEKLALEQRLEDAKRALNRAKSLTRQNVIFDDGQYTQSTLEKVQRAYQGLVDEFNALSDSEAELTTHLRTARARLATASQAARARARETLAELRKAVDASQRRLDGLSVRHDGFHLTASAAGYFVPAGGWRPGDRIEKGEQIGTLHVPADHGFLTARGTVQQMERIRTGHPVTVSLQDTRDSAGVRLSGRVVSIQGRPADVQAGAETLSLRVRYQIDAAAGGRWQGFANRPVYGTVVVETEGQRLWRHVFDLLVTT